MPPNLDHDGKIIEPVDLLLDVCPTFEHFLIAAAGLYFDPRQAGNYDEADLNRMFLLQLNDWLELAKQTHPNDPDWQEREPFESIQPLIDFAKENGLIES